uniref:Si:dkey-205h13.2 n=1 Tax=Cyprinus carpio carpio TaxID=630221 RepID=A0A8C0YNE2_CYPCA
MSIKVFVTWVVIVTNTIISPSTQSCITQWFDHDDPSDEKGDSELLADLLNIYPGQICPNPIDIDVEPVSGIPSNKTFFYIVRYNSTTGFECINSNQRGVCDDYKVRFTCPEEWCSTCRTPWFDQGNPSKIGDSETLSSIMLTYPLQVCAQPIAIEVATTSGIPVLPDARFPIYDPTQGFTCVNPPWIGLWWWKWWCQDYKVRFTCPRSFCQPKCVTRWYDSDDPDTNRGNFEFLSTILNKYPGEICRNPIAIEAQTVSGDPVYQTGNNIQLYISAYGFSCTNVKPGFCADYKVRFTCPDEWCSTCRTPWFDQDDPDKEGDWETLSSILLKYPLQVCAQPIAIEVVTTSGILVQPNGNFPINNVRRCTLFLQI